MSHRKVVEILCDGPDCLMICTTPELGVHEARDYARIQGWIAAASERKPGGGKRVDLCLHCKKRRK